MKVWNIGSNYIIELPFEYLSVVQFRKELEKKKIVIALKKVKRKILKIKSDKESKY